MRALVDEALAAGAIGFATSKSPSHRAVRPARPVPTGRVCGDRSCSGGLRSRRKGTVQATVGPGRMLDEFADLLKL